MTSATDNRRRYLQNTEAGLNYFWHPVATVDELGEDKPLGVTLVGRRWVLVRLGGQLTAFRDLCPHRLAPLSAGEIIGDTLQCPYHGFRFAVDGTCVEIPSNGPNARVPTKSNATRAYGVTERYGLIWLAPAEPVHDIVDMPEWTNPLFTSWQLAPRRTHLSAPTLLDTFNDAGAVPYLHPGTYPTEDPATQTHEVVAPLSLRLRAKNTAGASNAFLLVIQPESDTSSRIYFAQSYNNVAPDTALHSEVSAFNHNVLDKNLALLDAIPTGAL